MSIQIIDERVRTKLTLPQFDRLRYIAACGPVIRAAIDTELERLHLIQPYKGMPSFVEVTRQAISQSFEVGVVDEHLIAAAPALLEACKSTLLAFSQEQFCHEGHGCDDCSGCRQYATMRAAVSKAEGVQEQVAHSRSGRSTPQTVRAQTPRRSVHANESNGAKSRSTTDSANKLTHWKRWTVAQVESREASPVGLN